jgi:predicted dehydrogenase
MLNAAIVGVGHWGRRLVDSVRDSSKIRFVTGVSRNPTRDHAFTRDTGVPLVARMDDVLSDPAIAAIVLATPHSTHFEQIMKVARAGKHVYVEKPMTLTRADAEQAIEACRAAGVTLGVGFNRRFAPAPIAFVRRIHAGEIGKVLHVEGQHSGATGYQYQSTPGHWRATRAEAPGGGMTARGMHTVDKMVQIAGVVTSVYAYSERRILSADLDDTTCMLLRFSSGVSGYHATVFATGEYCRVHVFGSRGWMEMIDDRHITHRGLTGRRHGDLPAPNKERGVSRRLRDAVAAGHHFMVPRAHRQQCRDAGSNLASAASGSQIRIA